MILLLVLIQLKLIINLPKINDYIVYHVIPKINKRVKVVIVSRAGKATGNWFNVKNIHTGSFTSFDFSKVKGWDYLEEVLINNITEWDNSIEILKAKMNKFENWKDHKVFEEVEKWREKSQIS